MCSITPPPPAGVKDETSVENSTALEFLYYSSSDEKRYIWIPYAILALLMMLFLAASFGHYHLRKNRRHFEDSSRCWLLQQDWFYTPCKLCCCAVNNEIPRRIAEVPGAGGHRGSVAEPKKKVGRSWFYGTYKTVASPQFFAFNMLQAKAAAGHQSVNNARHSRMLHRQASFV